MNEGNNKNVKAAVENIISIIAEHGGMNRLGRMFRTKKQAYFYDSGTGKVVALEPQEEQFFNWLFNREEKEGCADWIAYNHGEEAEEAVLGIFAYIQQEHILQMPYPSKLQSRKHREELEETLDKGIRLITLELTGRCNLRCRYCIYNDGYCDNRNFTENDMSEETAIAAIDFVAQHCEEDIAVTFYGGEPLLRYELIRSV